MVVFLILQSAVMHKHNLYGLDALYKFKYGERLIPGISLNKLIEIGGFPFCAFPA